MKKNTVKLMVLTGVLFLGFAKANAQNAESRKKIAASYDQELLANLAEGFKKESTESKAKALSMAKERGWQITYTDDKGAYHELMGVTEKGDPIYANTLNQGSVRTAGADKLNSGGSMGLTLNGQEMTLGIWDGGYPLIGHTDLVGRTIIYDGSASNVQLHPTHVLGTMIGNGTTNQNARGFAYQGVGLVADWDNDLAEMTGAASGALLVSNHSYTFTPNPLTEYFFGAYASYARGIDDLAYNTPYYQPVIAAGNDRNDAGKNPTKNGNDLIYCYGVAKNVITVAAVNEVTNYVSPNSVVMSSFSSYGPTDDFRIKPDISAKGTNVLSCSNTSATSYVYEQGTSMAAPAVSGCVALIQQYYGETHDFEYALAATIKALIIHTAKEAGPREGPDHMFGWGLIDAAASVQALEDNGGASIVEEKTLTRNVPYSRNVYATGDKPLKVTVCWTDRPGTANNSIIDSPVKRLVNDLDIRVYKDGVEYLPWALTKTFTNPVAQRADNDADNVEKIEIPNPQAGNYTIRVSNKSNSFTGTVQNYSLVVTGIDEALAVTETAEKSIFNIYPNPASDNVTIVLTAGFEKAVVTFTDVQGRNVLTKNITAASAVVPVDGLNSGVYFVKIVSGNKEQVQKVIIK